MFGWLVRNDKLMFNNGLIYVYKYSWVRDDFINDNHFKCLANSFVIQNDAK